MSRNEPFPLHVSLQGAGEMELRGAFSGTLLLGQHPGLWVLAVLDHKLAAHSHPASPPAAGGFSRFLVWLQGPQGTVEILPSWTSPGRGLQHPEALAAPVSQGDKWLENSVLEMFVPAYVETWELMSGCQKDRNSNKLQSQAGGISLCC